MLTIYDLAKECNLAPSTISKVLNNYPGVSEKTKKIVHDAVSKLGYMPNISARSLSSNKSYMIGVMIYIDNKYPSLKHNLFAGIIEEFKKNIEKENYDLLLLSKKLELVQGKYLNHCYVRKTDGVICFGDYSNEAVRELIESDIPSVSFDYMGNKSYGVTCNNYEIVYKLTEHLISLGNTDIVYLTGEKNDITDLRLQAFTDAMNAHSLSIENNVIEWRYGSQNRTYELTKKLLSRPKMPHAIMYPDDVSAIAGYACCADMGIKVGQDISITGFDGIDAIKCLRPVLTTVVQDVALIGKVMADNLIDLIEGKKPAVQTAKIPASIQYGASCVKRN